MCPPSGRKMTDSRLIEASTISQAITTSREYQSARKPMVKPPRGRIHSLDSVIEPAASAVSPRFTCR